LGLSAGGWLAADAALLHAAGRRAARQARSVPPRFRVLTPEQAADVDAISAQIIPTDATPGAREAHVVFFIDQGLATFVKHLRPDFDRAYTGFRARVARAHPSTAFARLSAAQQIALLAALEKEKNGFFEQMRGATMAGMLANPEYGGNHDKIGWKLIGFEDRFVWGPPFGWYDRDVR
jgi:gluconate 2-dehydrogenase gamma chain